MVRQMEEQLAKLSRLTLEDSQRLFQDVEHIRSWMAQLDGEVAGEAAIEQAQAGALREDEVTASLSRQSLLQSAAVHTDTSFLVPPALGAEEQP